LERIRSASSSQQMASGPSKQSLLTTWPSQLRTWQPLPSSPASARNPRGSSSPPAVPSSCPSCWPRTCQPRLRERRQTRLRITSAALDRSVALGSRPAAVRSRAQLFTAAPAQPAASVPLERRASSSERRAAAASEERDAPAVAIASSSVFLFGTFGISTSRSVSSSRLKLMIVRVISGESIRA